MIVFDCFYQGEYIDIWDVDYQCEVYGEIDCCDYFCWQLW